MSNVVIALPARGFDPSEVAIPWKVLSERGHKVSFITPDGNPAVADPIMVTGKGLGPLKHILRADRNAREAYATIIAESAFCHPTPYDSYSDERCDMLVFPGGHDKSVIPYLESEVLQGIAARRIQENQPVAAICHGVLILARAQSRNGKSALHGRRVTSLVNRLETLAHFLTRLWMGDYYRTYPNITTEDEVRLALASAEDFEPGPGGSRRDTMETLHHGFVVRDNNILTARWPGDCHRWSSEIDALLQEKSA